MTQGSVITSLTTFADENLCLVRVVTQDGSEGWGATAPFDADLTAMFLHRKIAPRVLGHSATEHESLLDQAWDFNYKIIGPHLARALGGVDTALWDWRGRREGHPVCELVGGHFNSLKAYGSSMRRDNTPENEVQRLQAAAEKRGYRAFKVKIGGRLGRAADPSVDEVADRTQGLIRLMSQRLAGKDFQLMADANGSYAQVQQAVTVGRMMEDHGFDHYEEPCPFWDIESTAQIAAALKIHVTGGEQDWDLWQWRRMMTIKALDIVQPDVGYVGGFTRALRVARLAEAVGLECLPHTSNYTPVLLFGAHLQLALYGEKGWVETAIDQPDGRQSAYDPMPVVREGRLHLPEGPGWGWTPRPSWLERVKRTESKFEG